MAVTSTPVSSLNVVCFSFSISVFCHVFDWPPADTCPKKQSLPPVPGVHPLCLTLFDRELHSGPSCGISYTLRPLQHNCLGNVVVLCHIVHSSSALFHCLSDPCSGHLFLSVFVSEANVDMMKFKKKFHFGLCSSCHAQWVLLLFNFFMLSYFKDSFCQC